MGEIHELRFSVSDDVYQRRMKLPRDVTNRALFIKGVEAEEKDQSKKAKKEVSVKK